MVRKTAEKKEKRVKGGKSGDTHLDAGAPRAAPLLAAPAGHTHLGEAVFGEDVQQRGFPTLTVSHHYYLAFHVLIRIHDRFTG